MAFDHSRRRWFETCSCKPVSRGLPSSDKQLHATRPCGPCGPFALVAHDGRQTAPYACWGGIPVIRQGPCDGPEKPCHLSEMPTIRPSLTISAVSMHF